MEKEKTKAKLSQREYEEALAIDKEKTAALLSAPNLFNWFVGLNSIVSGASLALFSRIVENFAFGKFSAWIAPLQVVFVLGGIGLLLSELSRKGSVVWKVVFRLVLAAAYGALALIWWGGGKFDGVFIGLWLAMVILFNVVADLSSLRSYLVFYQGLIVGLLVILVYFSDGTMVGDLLSRYTHDLPLAGMWLALVLLGYVFASWWSYFRNKRASSILVGTAGVPLATLAVAYANMSAWIEAFIMLLTAIFALLLPFWDEVRFRLVTTRRLVLWMFGVVLSLFLLTVLLIKVLQNILISSTFTFLSDKVTYGRILLDSTVISSSGAVRALATNPAFAQAVKRGQEKELTEFSRTFFESNRTMLRVLTVDGGGLVLSAYPLTTEVVGQSVAAESYFRAMMSSRKELVSDVVVPLLELGQRTVAIVSPVMVDGRSVGGIIGFLDLTSLTDRLQEVATPRAGEYFVVLDRAGGWIVGPNIRSEKRFGDPLINTLMQRGVLGRGYSTDDLLTLTASSQMESTGFRVIVAQPLFAALVVNQTTYLIVLALASLSTVVVGLSMLVEREVEKGYEK